MSRFKFPNKIAKQAHDMSAMLNFISHTSKMNDSLLINFKSNFAHNFKCTISIIVLFPHILILLYIFGGRLIDFNGYWILNISHYITEVGEWIKI